MRRLPTRRRACAALVALLVVAAPAAAGPVNSTTAPTAKIKEIEDAGTALQRGRTDEALKLLEEAVRKKPDLPPARLMLARLLLAANTREAQQQGRAILEAAAAESPDHPQVYLTNASLALGDGRLTDTILNCERAMALSAADRWTRDQKHEVEAQARSGLASAFEARKDWADARTQLAALVAAEPLNGPLRQRLARALFFTGKADEAYQELVQAAKSDVTLDAPTVVMANLWAGAGDAAKAREWFDRAVKAEPNSARVHLAYANWLLAQDDVPQAKAHADAAAKINPNDADVQKLQGLVARVQGDLPAAEAIFDRLVQQAPADFFANNQLTLAQADQPNKKALALQRAQRDAQANQKSAEALATLGYVHYKNGNVDKALDVLKATVSGSGGQMSADTAYYLALCLNDKGQTEDAVKVLKGAVESKGLFVYRKDAKKLLDKLEKQAPPKPPAAGKR